MSCFTEKYAMGDQKVLHEIVSDVKYIVSFR